MKTPQEYFTDEYGSGHIAMVVAEQDNVSLFGLMQEYANWAISQMQPEWVKIHSEADLPKDHDKRYKVFFKDKKTKSISEFPYPLSEVIKDWEGGFISHYKPIVEDLPPLD